MAASETGDPDSPAEKLASLVERMQALVAAGSWDEAEALAGRLRAAVMEVPTAGRREALHAVQSSIDKAASAARSEYRLVKKELAAMRRGEMVKKAYETR